MTSAKRRLTFEQPRELLLTEITRRCRACDSPARVGLTKQEARDYAGFECEACDEWNEDALGERDIPEWWEELRITGLDSLRPRADDDADSDACEPGAVKRLSDAWREEARGDTVAAQDSTDKLSRGASFDSSSDDPAGSQSPDGSLEGSF